VPAVDADGDERAGVLLPDIAVPLGTYTGRNLYAAEGLRGGLCDRAGNFAPSRRTAPGANRQATRASPCEGVAATAPATRAAGLPD
jgi:hypothetical protein